MCVKSNMKIRLSSNLCFQIFILFCIGGLSFEFECPENCSCDGTTRDVSCTGLQQSDLGRISKEIDNNTKSLELTGNKLIRFDTPFRLENLNSLDLSNNLLTSIPSGLNNMFPILRELKINSNNITELKASYFEGLANLTKLTLDNNKLTTLNNGVFQNLVNLKQLVIKSNKISKLPKDVFKGLSKLVNLDFTANQISELNPNLFDHFLDPAIAIMLPQNKLKELPNRLLTKLKQLKTLEVSSNQISVLGDNVFDSISITELLNLSDNELASLPIDSLLNSSIKVISTLGNPIHCTCNMRKLFPKYNNKLYGKCMDGKTNVTFNDLSTKTADEISKAFCNRCDLNNTCLNGGQCKPVGKTDLECQCVDNYYGPFCEFSPVCSTVQCKHGGTCVPVNVTGYECICDHPYSGRDCEHEEDYGDGLSDAGIAGIVLGIVFLILIIIVIIIFTRKHCQKQKDEDPKDPNEMSSLNPKSV